MREIPCFLVHGYFFKRVLLHLPDASARHRASARTATGEISMGRWLTIAVLLGLLALVAWVGYGLWTLVDVDMPGWAWAALGFGVGLSLLIGFGLMALLL